MEGNLLHPCSGVEILNVFEKDSIFNSGLKGLEIGQDNSKKIEIPKRHFALLTIVTGNWQCIDVNI